MAEILRGDQLKERSEKARNVDMKLHDAKRRRMFRVAQAEAMGNRRSVSECSCLSVCLLVRPSVRVSVCLSACPSVRLSVYLSVCLTVCPHQHQFVLWLVFVFVQD